MTKSREGTLNDLLVRWYRWSTPPTRVGDTLLHDFGELMNQLPPEFRAALVTQARNMACGVHVWDSPRVNVASVPDARRGLHLLLEQNATRWYGHLEIMFTERGNRVGETHHNAILTDEDVALLIALHEEGKTFDWLADKFEIHRSTAWGYCTGRLRAQTPARSKKVER